MFFAFKQQGMNKYAGTVRRRDLRFSEEIWNLKERILDHVLWYAVPTQDQVVIVAPPGLTLQSRILNVELRF